jgi:hypothetical protein
MDSIIFIFTFILGIIMIFIVSFVNAHIFYFLTSEW